MYQRIFVIVLGSLGVGAMRIRKSMGILVLIPLDTLGKDGNHANS